MSARLVLIEGRFLPAWAQRLESVLGEQNGAGTVVYCIWVREGGPGRWSGLGRG